MTVSVKHQFSENFRFVATTFLKHLRINASIQLMCGRGRNHSHTAKFHRVSRALKESSVTSESLNSLTDSGTFSGTAFNLPLEKTMQFPPIFLCCHTIPERRWGWYLTFESFKTSSFKSIRHPKSPWTTTLVILIFNVNERELSSDTEPYVENSVLITIRKWNVEMWLVPLDVWMLLCHGIVMIGLFCITRFSHRGLKQTALFDSRVKKWRSVD